MNLELWPAFVANWTSPGIIFLSLGGAAALIRADLRFPRFLRTAVMIVLLLVLGFDGGRALSEVGFDQIWKQSLAMLGFGAIMPLWLWPCFRYLGRVDASTSGLAAVQLTSGNAAVFAVTVMYLKTSHEFADDLGSGFLLLIPFAGLIAGGCLAGYMAPKKVPTPWWQPLATTTLEALRSGSFLLLLTSSIAGYFAARTGVDQSFGSISNAIPILGTLLMLDLGLQMGRQWRRFDGIGWVCIALGSLGAVINAGMALYLAHRAHLGSGLGTLLAMAAATGVVRMGPGSLRRVFPGSQSSGIEALESGVVLPIQLLIGLPVYWQLAHRYL